MNISVFGGSQPKEGDTAYAEALELGRLLAQRGHTVLTGGYIGTMEAVSRGANEAGGHVIGVTCEDIESWRDVRPNQWVKEERRRKTLIERMQILIHDCDAVLALPGGVGTLAEIMLMWNLMAVESRYRSPLILIGSGWKSTFDQFFRELDVYTSAKQRELIGFADDIKIAIKMIENPVVE